MAAVETGGAARGLDDRLALLFVACDEALAPGAQMVLALRVVCGLTIAETAMHLGIQESRRGRTADPGQEGAGAGARASSGCPTPPSGSSGCRSCSTAWPGCSPSRTAPGSTRPTRSPTSAARLSRSPTPWWRCSPRTPRCAGCGPSSGSGWPAGPARVDDDGVALTLDEMDRSRWDQRLLRAGLDDATFAALGGRPVRPRGGDLRAAQRRAVVRGDRLAADRAALRGARAGVALPRGARRPARRAQAQVAAAREPT